MFILSEISCYNKLPTIIVYFSVVLKNPLKAFYHLWMSKRGGGNNKVHDISLNKFEIKSFLFEGKKTNNYFEYKKKSGGSWSLLMAD